MKQAEITKAHEFIMNLKFGYNTHLSRLLNDGEDLSGGQWQKIAFTRTLFKDSQIIILDEPTAALDPKSEKNLFDQIEGVSKDKTVIFISHRVSATKFADKIIFMKNGEACEIGTYDELINKKGEFFKLFNTQSQTKNMKVLNG